MMELQRADVPVVAAQRAAAAGLGDEQALDLPASRPTTLATRQTRAAIAAVAGATCRVGP